MTRQNRIAAWAVKVLGEEAATNIPERSLRTAEEAIELAQACGVDAASVHRLVDYVFSRPVGNPAQEIAGTMVTLYAMAAAVGVHADTEFEIEVERIHQPEVIERCQRRQIEKREALAPRLSVKDIEIKKVLDAAREVVRRLYHKHADSDGKPYGPGGCFSSMYETCGEHHAHDMNCGGYPRWCRREESSYVVNELNAAFASLDAKSAP